MICPECKERWYEDPAYRYCPYDGEKLDTDEEWDEYQREEHAARQHDFMLDVAHVAAGIGRAGALK